jgi:phosphatidylglycerophosphatase A
LDRLARIIASGIYSGYSPLAPGTVGSLVGLAIYLICGPLSIPVFAAVIVVAFLVGVWSSSVAEGFYGRDGKQIVIDEIVGMWIALFALPRSASIVILAFLVFRALDIVKPFPAHSSQKLPGGWGVMMDDLIVAIYSNILLRLAAAIAEKTGRFYFP